MTIEAQLYQEGINTIDYNAPTVAKTAGEVVQLADGRAGVITSDIAAAGYGGCLTAGHFKVLKTADIVLLEGQEVWWVKSTGKMSYTGDFPIGVMSADAAAADTVGYVFLNIVPKPVIELGKGEWTWGVTNGLGIVWTGNVWKLEFDSTSEAAMAALYSVATIALDQGPIMEIELAIVDDGAEVNDINVGLANETHATDFDSVAEFAGVHVDAANMSALVESDDGTTEVAATDSTIDFVASAYTLVQVDARNLADVKAYINGVDAGALAAETLVLSDATGPVFPIVHVEKTTSTALADIRVRKMQVRTARTV